MVLEDLFLLLHFFTRPPIFVLVHVRFYPSKWRVDGSLHKAMHMPQIGHLQKQSHIVITSADTAKSIFRFVCDFNSKQKQDVWHWQTQVHEATHTTTVKCDRQHKVLIDGIRSLCWIKFVSVQNITVNVSVCLCTQSNLNRYSMNN